MTVVSNGYSLSIPQVNERTRTKSGGKFREKSEASVYSRPATHQGQTVLSVHKLASSQQVNKLSLAQLNVVIPGPKLF